MGSATGLAWAILHPLALLGVYHFVFTTVFRAGNFDGRSFLVFVAVALWPWLAAQEALVRATVSLGGYAEYAVASIWTRKPDTVSWIDAAALPSSAEAAVGVLRQLNVTSGETLLLFGGGGSVGIIATQLANSLINRGGPTLLVAARDRSGASVAELTRAYAAVRDAFALQELHAEIDALDAKIPGQLQLDLYAVAHSMSTTWAGGRSGLVIQAIGGSSFVEVDVGITGRHCQQLDAINGSAAVGLIAGGTGATTLTRKGTGAWVPKPASGLPTTVLDIAAAPNGDVWVVGQDQIAKVEASRTQMKVSVMAKDGSVVDSFVIEKSAPGAR